MIRRICIFSFIIFLSALFFSCQKGGVVIEPTNPPTSVSADRNIKDTAYGSDPKQKMDIYLPAGRSSNKTRTVVLIHGGAWIGGDKAELNNYVLLIRSKWPDAAIVNINYRFANGKNILYNELMTDIDNAIALLTKNKEQFGINGKMALLGASAGGHLALMYAYTKNKGHIACVADLYGPAKLNDQEWYNSNWPNVANWLKMLSGQTWNNDLYTLLSPLSYVKAQSPPTAIFHSVNDIVVPVNHSRLLKATLAQAGVPHIYKEYSDSWHVFNDADNNDCSTRCVAFFKKYMQ